MSINADRYARRVCHDHPELSRSARAVLLALAGYCDRQGRCFPSRSELAAIVGLNLTNTSRAVTELERAGAVAVTRSSDGRTPNSYRFPLSTGVLQAAPQGCRSGVLVGGAASGTQEVSLEVELEAHARAQTRDARDDAPLPAGFAERMARLGVDLEESTG